MYVLHDEASMLAALDLPLEPDLKSLLACRVRHTLDGGLGSLTTIIVLRASDPEEALAGELGGPLLRNGLSGLAWGEPDFWPELDWLEAHRGWWEAVRCVGDGGFAYVLLLEERSDALGAMLRAHVDQSK